MKLSVIICTHNPREDYLQRTLDGLKAQTLPPDQWEFILIDNLSEKPLAERVDLSWHPNSRIIREEELGLTPARLRGIRESVGELLVFVDDDNVLMPGYLSQAININRSLPHIGVYGGNIFPEFEIQPPPDTKPMWPSLALRMVERDRWANFPIYPSPCGAGLCVTKKIAIRFADRVAQSAIRKMLGRKGSSLASAEDDDIAATSLEMGLGIGLFTMLQLTHLIDKRRCSEAYLLRLEESIVCSGTLLEYANGGAPHMPGKDSRSFKRRLFSKFIDTADEMLSSRIQKKRRAAHQRGRAAALRKINEIEGQKLSADTQ